MNVLAVGCHPDDLEIACGGTLAKYAEQGADVYICHVANGDMGHTIIEPDELAGIRKSEAQNAGKKLGAREVLTLGVSDLKVNHYAGDITDAMVEVVRYTKPDVIITHNEADYMQDHVEVSKLVFDASFTSSIVHKATKSAFHNPIVPIFYMDTLAGVDFAPEQYVDITDYIDVKLQALAAHESQIKWMLEHDHVDFLDFVKTCSKFRGYQSSVSYAEAFRTCKTWPRVTTKKLLP